MAAKRAKKKAHHPEVSDAQLATLARGAAEGRDHEVVKLCARALMGNRGARLHCARIIHASRHMKGSA